MLESVISGHFCATEVTSTHDDVRSVRRSENNDAIQLLDAVHFGEQAHEDAVAGRTAALIRSARGRKCVNLVL